MVVLRCKIIYSLLIIEQNGDASSENLKNHECPTTVMTLCTLLV